MTLVFGLQGVTLTDLQEAEKTMKTENKGKEKDEEDKDGKQKKGDEGVRFVELPCLLSDGLFDCFFWVLAFISLLQTKGEASNH